MKGIWEWFYIRFQTHKIFWIVIGVLILGAGLELGLNLWLRTALRRQFIDGGNPGYRLEARMSWLNLFDLASGKVRRISIKAEDCLISDLLYQSLEIDNQGIDFDLPRLFTENKLIFEDIKKTRVRGVVNEQALTEYLSLKYPQYRPEIRMVSGRIRVSGDVSLFGAETRVQVVGGLKASGPKTLRFYPEQVQIAARKVPTELLQFISTQLPLEFSLMENWPLQILEFSIADRMMSIELMEISDYPA